MVDPSRIIHLAVVFSCDDAIYFDTCLKRTRADLKEGAMYGSMAATSVVPRRHRCFD